jgi:hypothetical protein
MLVRLAPGASYPAHTHASAEELHLFDGELWIDGRKPCEPVAGVDAQRTLASCD